MNSGGTPGNPGGGRKPNKFVAECARAADEDVLPKCVAYLQTHNLADDAAAWKWAAEYVTNYGKGKPVQPIDTDAVVPHEEALDALDRGPVE